jgi:hypothetical protein
MDFTGGSQSDIHACLAFYGLDEDTARAQTFYKTSVTLCCQQGHPPTHLSVSRSGRKGTITSFQAGDKRLNQLGFQSVNMFTLKVCPEDHRSMLDAELTCSWSESATGYAVFDIRSDWLDFGDTTLREWLRQCVLSLRPEYGIGYYRPRRLAPGVYALGFGVDDGSSSEETLEERRRRKRWGTNAMFDTVWREGVLRDVYPWNILTRPQLDHHLSDVSLHDWIKGDLSRGVLSELTQECWLWELTREQAEAVRPVLLQAGMIFCPSLEADEN